MNGIQGKLKLECVQNAKHLILTEKKCSKCRKIKLVSEFNKKSVFKDGLNCQCRHCTQDDYRKYYKRNRNGISKKNRIWREENLKWYQEYSKKYLKTENGKRRACESALRQAQKWPEKICARKSLNYAVQSGRVERGVCMVCGSGMRVEGHHEDYSAHFDVIWFCSRHHHNYHKIKKAGITNLKKGG